MTRPLTRRGRIHVSARTVALGLAIAIFVMLCVLPAAWMVGVSFLDSDGGLTVRNYSRLFAESRQRRLMLNTALLGAGSSLFATLIGAPLGLLFAHTIIPLKRSLRIALVTPLLIPPYILALAWVYVGGPTGLIAQLFGRDLLSDWTYSLTGTVVVLGAGFYPLAMLSTEAAARRVDGRLEEAALLVASRPRVLWRITLRLIAPSVVATALVIFVLAVSEFGAPGLLRARVFTTEVFTAFSALYDFGAATAMSIPLLVAALIAGAAAQFVIGERLLVTRRGANSGSRLLAGRKPIVFFVALLVIAVCALLPLIALALEAGKMQRVFEAAARSRTAIRNSLWLAVTGATIITMLSVLLGYGRARARTRLRGLGDLVMIVIFAVPSTVTGVGLIGLWNRPRLGVYGTEAIVVIAYLARFVPVATLMLAASVRQVPVSFEEAAELSGAGWMRAFARIVLPQIKTGIAASWVVAFIFAFGELGATVLVAPPGESTLPIRIYTLIANTSTNEVAALALTEVAVIMAPIVLLGLVAKEEKAKETTNNA